MTGAPRTIESIQHLRALAALGVVVFHALGLLETHFAVETPHRSLGAAGVDLFFIISGFIMWVTAIDRDEAPARFAWKRILRIVPMYWLITTLVLLIVLVRPQLMNSASRDPAHFVASYFFIAWPHPMVEGRLWPPVIPGWTLNYEMFFYAVVTVSLLLRHSRRVAFIAAVLAGLPFVGSLLQPSGIAAFYTHPILLEFPYGVAIGAFFTAGRGQGPKASIALLLAGIALFATVGLAGDERNRAAAWALPLAVLVQGALHAPALARGRVREFSKLLGDASYSLYLTQFVVLPPAAKLLGGMLSRLPPAVSGPLFVAGLVLCAVAGGIAAYWFAERPILQAAQRWRGR